MEFYNRLPQSRFVMSWSYFYMLLNHGFRATELQLLHKWTDHGGGVYSAFTKKKGSTRVISEDYLSYLITLSILSEENQICTRGYDHYEDIFLLHNPAKGFVIGGKNSGTHVFRHNYIKRLHDGGMDYEAIRVHMGLQSVATVEGYVTSEVYAKKWPI